MKTINNIFDQSFFRGCILIVLICSFNISNAITVTSVQSGNWNDPATWDCTCEPDKKDNVIISSGDTVTLNDDITIHDLTIESLAVLDVAASSFKISIEGSWINDGTFIQRVGEVIFKKKDAQSIGGSNATSFYNLTIENKAAVTLAAPITVIHTLTLTKGILYTGASNYITLGPAATTIGASDKSHIDGRIKIHTDTIKRIVFDTGKNGKHKKIAIDVNSTDTTAFIAEYFDVVYVDTSVGPGIDHLITTEYWQLYRVAGSAGVSVTLYWDEGGNGPIHNLSDARVVQFDSTQWVDAGNTAITWNPPSIMSDSLNSCGYFTFGCSNTCGQGDDDTTTCGENKVKICHIPPGNPSNAHAICISPNALNAHLAHGDYEGPCESSDSDSSDTDTSGTGNDILEFEISVAPNPYSGYTTIQYALPEDGYMLIEVYNQQGDKIQTIVSAVQVEGVYSYQFSAVSLGYSPGYFLLNYTFWGTQTINGTVVLIEL